MKAALRILVSALSLVAAAVWLGGIVVLGAVVAPTVFRIVHAPDSADAMTTVFLTFDKIAMSAAVVIAVTEVLRSRMGPVRRVDLARLSTAVVASGLAFAQGLWLSPRIAELHAHGAVRNVGELGQRLESVHRMSEFCGKTESVALVVFLVLVAASFAPNESSSSASVEPR
jgi:uncharacterized membrane protein